MSYSRLNPLALGANPSGASCIQKIDAELDNVFSGLNALDAAKPSLVAGLVPMSNLPAATAAETAAQASSDKLVTPASLVGLALGHGECQLGRSGATALRLSPVGPGRIMVKTAEGWTARRIGVDGLSLNASSIVNLTAGATYYVYACADGAGLALEASTTGHAKDADTGVEVKSTDPTRTLAGMVRTNAAAQFQDDPGFRGVSSFFNRQPKELRVDEPNYYTLAAGTSTPTAIGASPLRFLSWAGPTDLHAQATVYSLAAVFKLYTGIDGVASSREIETYTPDYEWLPVHLSTRESVSEGWHTFDAMFTLTGGGSSYWGNNVASPAERWGKKDGIVWG